MALRLASRVQIPPELRGRLMPRSAQEHKRADRIESVSVSPQGRTIDLRGVDQLGTHFDFTFLISSQRLRVGREKQWLRWRLKKSQDNRRALRYTSSQETAKG